VFRDGGIEVIDIDGSNHRLLFDDSGYGAFHPAWSPDGRRIVFTVGTFVDSFPPLGLWVINADGSDARRIGLYDAELPVWSPDSSEIAFVTTSGGIDVSNADGSGRRSRVAGPAVWVDWTPDGRLIFTKSQSRDWYGPGQRIFISDGGAERQLIPDAAAPARSTYSDRHPAWRR